MSKSHYAHHARWLFSTVAAIFCVIVASKAAYSAELIITRSDGVEVSGKYKDKQFFSTQNPRSRFVKIEIELVTGKLVAFIGRDGERGNRQISFFDAISNTPSTITSDDRQLVGEMLDALAYNSLVYKCDHGKILLKVLNLITAWPVEQLDLSQVFGAPQSMRMGAQPEVVPTDCGIPDDLNGITDLCQQMDEQREARYANDGTYCGLYSPRGYEWLPDLKVDEPVDPWANSENPNPVIGGGDCVGRCGKGCIGAGQPDNGLNIYTQDCLNHDICVAHRGYVNAECNWMLVLAAEDDFWDGENCTSASDVIADIKANGEDADILVNLDDKVEITISLDPDDFVKEDVDWWIYADTPDGPIYRSGIGWFGKWNSGIERSAKSKLKNIESRVIFNEKLDSQGEYDFHFAVDENGDGERDETWKDSVRVVAQDADLFLDGNIGCSGQEPQLFFHNMPVSVDTGSFTGESQGFDYDGDPIYFKIEGTFDWRTSWVESLVYMFSDPQYQSHIRTDKCEDDWEGGSFYDGECVLVADTSAGCVPIFMEMTLSGQQRIPSINLGGQRGDFSPAQSFSR